MEDPRKRRRWDKVWVGILIGLSVPLAAYGILLTAFDFMDAWGMLEGRSVSPTFRERTLSLVAFCLNIIPLQVFNRKYMYQAMRGLVFPTLLYALFWVIRYYDILFSY